MSQRASSPRLDSTTTSLPPVISPHDASTSHNDCRTRLSYRPCHRCSALRGPPCRRSQLLHPCSSPGWRPPSAGWSSQYSTCSMARGRHRQRGLWQEIFKKYVATLSLTLPAHNALNHTYALSLSLSLSLSLVCCIYHKPRAFDESSSGSSSESDSGDSRHDHPGPRCRPRNRRRHPRKNSSDSDQPGASSSSNTGATAHESSSVTATEAQNDPVHEQSDSDSDNAYEARPSKRYKAYRAEGQRDP